MCLRPKDIQGRGGSGGAGALPAAVVCTGTPQSIVKTMSQAMNKVAGDPELQQVLFGVAMAPNLSSPEELAALLRDDY